MNHKSWAVGSLVVAAFFTLASVAVAEESRGSVKVPGERARVFVTDSQSWEVRGGGGGTSEGFGSAGNGGARPQTAEIVKTFGERCPDVITNNIKEKADYVVVLDHEGGKSFLLHRNKVVVFTRVTGDSVTSKSTYSLGASVQEACNAIRADWSKNAESIHSAAAAESKKPAVAASPAADSNETHVTVASMPTGADIEVDGSFVGNTPSTINLPAGDHTVVVSKSGYKSWERKMKANGGTVNLNLELEQQQEAKK
ncbi:MAG TPA: PEGA domain-containing protein [Terriglobales bacterium]|nr:PEGA domain-containing protein [Terriglobales bacterium]